MNGTARFRIASLFLAVAWTGILTAIAGGILAIAWLTYPYRGLAVTPEPFPVNKGTVVAGDLISYTFHYCVDARLPVPINIDRELELQAGDGVTFAIAPPMSYSIDRRCETRTVFLGIPEYLPPGRYHIHTNTSLRVNPLRTVSQRFESERFTILARK